MANDTTFRILLFLSLFGVLLILEVFWPLRRMTQSKSPRLLTNLGIAAVGGVVMRFLFFPVLASVSERTAGQHWGLLGAIDVPASLKTIPALIALDYTLYLWHWMNHRFAFFWRFHNVHHTDLDLDVSTAARFHFGELILSVGFRAGQILVIGVTPGTWLLFEALITSFTQFRHGNLRLPLCPERLLVRLIVTPRMHGIHHSWIRNETNSNYSTIISVWDRLHRSIQLNIRQAEITIGVPSYRDPSELPLLGSFLLPLDRPRGWTLPRGSAPVRTGGPRSGRSCLST